MSKHAPSPERAASFHRVLSRTMKLDPEARSSMSEDLQRGRPTEIDHLQGVIVALAERHGVDVRLSRTITRLIEEAEAEGKGSPRLAPEPIVSAQRISPQTL